MQVGVAAAWPFFQDGQCIAIALSAAAWSGPVWRRRAGKALELCTARRHCICPDGLGRKQVGPEGALRLPQDFYGSAKPFVYVVGPQELASATMMPMRSKAGNTDKGSGATTRKKGGGDPV